MQALLPPEEDGYISNKDVEGRDKYEVSIAICNTCKFPLLYYVTISICTY